MMKPSRIGLLSVVIVFVRISALAQVTDNASTFHVFAQIADGRTADGSYFRSTLMVANPSDTLSASCAFRLYGLRTTLLGVGGSILGAATDIFSFTLSKNGWEIASSQALQSLATGYATLACDRAVTAQILYSWFAGNSTKLSEATVFSSPAAKTVQLLADHREGGRLGFALANDSDRPVTYVIAAGDVNGIIVGSATLTVGARSSTARFIDEIVSGIRADYRGQVIVTTIDNSNVYAIGLRFTGIAFTTIPVTIRPNVVVTPTPVAIPTLTTIAPTSGTAGTTLTAALTGANFVTGGTTVRVSGAGITVGTPQVTGSTTLSVTLTIDATASADTRSVTVVTNAGTSNALNFSVVPATKSFNQTQTERLFGTWTFTYTIISAFTSTYRLNNVQPSTVTPGDWNIFGTDSTGDLVLAGYSSSLGRFTLYDPGSIIDRFFVFDFNGTNTVSGCYYQISPPGSTNLGSCYQMTGIRTSTSALTSADDTGSEELTLDEEARMSQKVEGAESDLNIIRALDSIQRQYRSFIGR